MSRKSPIKNIIFDLGGVILDLSVDQTLQAFADLSGLSKVTIVELFHTSAGFSDYEKGLINDNEFRSFIRALYSISDSDEKIDACWNAMLGNISIEKLLLLEQLKLRYKTFLLSNTNEIHLGFINTRVMPGIEEARTLDSYFDKAYYSHRMLKRKPDQEIFRQVLSENSLIAEETLFFDDNKQNIDGAKSLGIQTVLVTDPRTILTYIYE